MKSDGARLLSCLKTKCLWDATDVVFEDYH